MRVTLSEVFAFSSNISLYNKLTKIQSLVFKSHIYQFHWHRGYKQRIRPVHLPELTWGGANFQLFYVVTHQMWARVVLGRPLCRKMLRISSPDTKPSMSVSAILNIWSNFILSTGFTTHWMAICKNQATQVIASSHTIIFKQYNLRSQAKCCLTRFFLWGKTFVFQTTGVYKS